MMFLAVHALGRLLLSGAESILSYVREKARATASHAEEESDSGFSSDGEKDEPAVPLLTSFQQAVENAVDGVGSPIPTAPSYATDIQAVLARSGYTTPKLRVCVELCREAVRNGEKILVFSQWISSLEGALEELRSKLPEARVALLVASKDNNATFARFHRNDIDVLLLSIGAFACGLNLQEANKVILLDSDWNPQRHTQAIARVYRLGQTRPVTVYRLVSRGSYEEQIMKAALAKTWLFRRAIDSKRDGAQKWSNADQVGTANLFSPANLNAPLNDNELRRNDRLKVELPVLQHLLEDKSVMTAIPLSLFFKEDKWELSRYDKTEALSGPDAVRKGYPWGVQRTFRDEVSDEDSDVYEGTQPTPRAAGTPPSTPLSVVSPSVPATPATTVDSAIGSPLELPARVPHKRTLAELQLHEKVLYLAEARLMLSESEKQLMKKIRLMEQH
eukprot:Sspe_Gene.12473::Locus_4250_Transcript_1_1_Confidence_1.000_Length_2767::g.12473::m.12473